VEEVLDGRGKGEERHGADEQRAGAHQRLLQQVDHRLYLQRFLIGERDLESVHAEGLCPVCLGVLVSEIK